MRSNIVITRLARGAVASTVAAWLMPQSHNEVIANPVGGCEAAFTDRTSLPDAATEGESHGTTFVTVTQAPSEWDKQLEREFRKLALEEAKGTLAPEQSERLEELSHWRDNLLCPPPPEEILLQIRRDRLLEKTEELLRAYVEFQEATGKKRAAA
jgi:hypothetical protein